MTAGKKTEKTRRISAARLFLWFCLAFVAVFLLAGGGEYALRSRRTFSALPPRAALPSPETKEAEDKNGWMDDDGEPLDLNAADFDSLQSLPGIGPATARAILDYRDQNGPFRFPEELMDIPGIGQKRFDALRKLVFCGPEGSP